MKRIFALISFALILNGSTANAMVDFENCEIIQPADVVTLPELICKDMTANADTVQNELLKEPYTEEDLENYYEGIGWLNAEEELAIGKGYITYTTDTGAEIASLVGESVTANMIYGPQQSLVELDFASSADVTGIVTAKLENMGISATLARISSYSVEDLLKEYAAEVESLSQIETADDDGDYSKLLPKADWTKGDECYILYYMCTEFGCPVSADGYYSEVNKTSYDGSYIVIVYTAEGIMYVEAFGLYEVMKTTDDDQPLIDENAAAEILTSLYCLYDVDVYRARLEWMGVPVAGDDPEKAYALVPVWVFTEGRRFNQAAGNPEDADAEMTAILTDFAYIDARTGEEL